MDNKKPNVGACIRKMRERRGLSLRALAERCDLSINAISRIERGENSPTVASLHLLAGALEVPITDFFAVEHDHLTVSVKADRRLTYTQDDFIMESLGIGLSNQQIEPFLFTIRPVTGNLLEPITHPGQEFVYCLEGEVTYRVGEQDYHLEPGDSLMFDAMQPHCYQNDSTHPAVLLVVFQAAGGGYLARQRHLEG